MATFASGSRNPSDVSTVLGAARSVIITATLIPVRHVTGWGFNDPRPAARPPGPRGRAANPLQQTPHARAPGRVVRQHPGADGTGTWGRMAMTADEKRDQLERFLKCINGAHAHAKAAGLKRGHGGAGEMPCPSGCGGTLKYSVASVNGHLWGACTTAGCARWME
jgi:hypothetical protein